MSWKVSSSAQPTSDGTAPPRPTTPFIRGRPTRDAWSSTASATEWRGTARPTTARSRWDPRRWAAWSGSWIRSLAGTSLAPYAVAAFALADEIWGTAIGPALPAPSLR